MVKDLLLIQFLNKVPKPKLSNPSKLQNLETIDNLSNLKYTEIVTEIRSKAYELLKRFEKLIFDGYKYQEFLKLLHDYIGFFSNMNNPSKKKECDYSMRTLLEFADMPSIIVPTFFQINYEWILNTMAAPIINFRLSNRRKKIHGNFLAPCNELLHDIYNYKRNNVEKDANNNDIDYLHSNHFSRLTNTHKAQAQFIINKLNFSASAVDTARNTITIPNHGLYTSQKVIYTSTSPSGGLSNEAIYYVIVVDKNTIKLSDNYYYSSRVERNEVDITSSSDGSISPINPSINLTNKSTLIFDVSSTTLSFVNSGILYSAFDLDFYTDSNFKFPFKFTDSNNVEVIKMGRVGIDTNATVTLKINDSTPRKIYYKLTPTNLEIIPTVKEEIIVDDEIIDNSSINIKESIYSGNQVISGIASTAFTYLLSNTPERSSYNQENSSISYITNSTSAYGEIESISTNYGGLNLKSIPEIVDVSSEFGSGEVLELSTDSIGKVIKTTIDDIGFGYSNDYSVRPTAKLPDVIKVTPQASFKSIGVSSVGKGYSIAPDLVVLDGLTNNIVSDVDLRYNLDSKTVTILKNTKSPSFNSSRLTGVDMLKISLELR